MIIVPLLLLLLIVSLLSIVVHCYENVDCHQAAQERGTITFFSLCAILIFGVSSYHNSYHHSQQQRQHHQTMERQRPSKSRRDGATMRSHVTVSGSDKNNHLNKRSDDDGLVVRRSRKLRKNQNSKISNWSHVTANE